MEQIYANLDQTVDKLRQRGFGKPQIAIVLGSGLGELAQRLEHAVAVDYSDIPGFPQSTVVGHAGRLVFGRLAGVSVVAMQGRFHFYEGYSQQTIAYAIRLLQALGAQDLVVTNAAGGLNPDFQVGDFMLIADHINFTGDNPLIGPNLERFGPRFPDMSQAYTPKYRRIVAETAEEMQVPLHQGVYLSVSGPSFESPAEIRTFRNWGADAVGMSTVPEVITAVHAGMGVVGISCITNLAAGLGAEQLDHQEVIETTERIQTQFEALVTKVVAKIGRES